jgi:hypothetical protein
VDRTFEQRYSDRLERSGKPYPRSKTEHWLRWLAWQLVRTGEGTFFMERLQRDWLPRQRPWRIRLVYSLTLGAVGACLGLAGMLVGGLVPLLASRLAGRPDDGLASWLSDGFFGGLIVGFVGLLVGLLDPSLKDPIKCAEKVKWSFHSLTVSSNKLMVKFGILGLVFGLVLGLTAGLFTRQDLGLSRRLALGLVFGLGGGLIGGLFGRLSEGLSVSEVDKPAVPNEGIQRSGRNALVFGLVDGLIVCLIVWLAVGLGVWLAIRAGIWAVPRSDAGFGGELTIALLGGLSVGLIFGLVFGLLGGLTAGGRAFLKHLILRRMLVQSGSAPWQYVQFLDQAAERILLRKVGDGYVFIHRMLMEYFAAQHHEGL